MIVRKIRTFTFFLINLFFLSGIIYAQNPTQTVKGQVFDIDSKEPLIGASIVLSDSNPIVGGTTDVNGTFNISNVPLGRQTFNISYMGYETGIFSEVLITSGKEVFLEVGLKQNVTEMNEVVILANIRKDRSLNSMAIVSARTFSVEEGHRYAGGLDDPARLVSAYAGVTTGNLQDNSIIVRGNAPQGVSWRLEGIEIPTPHHFAGANVTGGGFVTLFSSHVMSNSDFFTAAFPAEYGSALAAVFDMKLRTGNSDKKEHTAQIGLLGIDLASEGPFSRKSDASYLFNFRYSTFGLLSDLKILDMNEQFTYQDLSFKLNFPTRKAGTFSLWGIGGIDRSSEANDSEKKDWEIDSDRIIYTWDTYLGAVGITHRIPLGYNTYLRSVAAYSGVNNKMINSYVNDDYTLSPDMDFVYNTSTINISSVLNHKFNAKLSSRSGLTYKKMFYGLDIAGTEHYVPGTYRQIVKEDGNTNVGEFFSQIKYNASQQLSLNGGLHFGYFGVNDEITIEPRIGLQWALQPHHTISLGYGLHSRPEALKMYLMEIDGKQPNTSLKLSKAHHLVLGYDWRIAKNLRLKMEGYYQHIYDVPGEKGTSFSLINYKQDYTLHKSMINNTVGRNIGLDVTLEKFLSKNYYYLLTGSLFDSKYKAGDGVWHNTRYNKGFVVNTLYGREFFFRDNTQSLDCNIRFSVSGGERYSPFLKEKSIKHQRIVTDDTKAFSEQYDAMFYADFTINYRINHRKSSSQLSLQIKNLLGSPNIVGYNYNLKTNDIELDEQSTTLPVISYKIEF